MITNAAEKNPFSSIAASVKDTGSGIYAGIEKTGSDLIASVQSSQFGVMLRGLGVPFGAENTVTEEGQGATWGNKPGEDLDWRVRLSIAPRYLNEVTKPLEVSNGLVFPLTPTIMVQNTASYTSIKPIHSNYPFYAYQNSAVENITITGEFPVENEDDGHYWIAATHYLRSVTKMAYGETANAGAPPPVIQLNGYGPFIFNQVPVVVTNFTVELVSDIDYILVDTVGPQGTYVPTKSQISVTLIPMYSRRKVKDFRLEDFVEGYYALPNDDLKGMI